MSKHTFALYCQFLSIVKAPITDKVFELVDKELWHRITHVLRLTTGEEIILFDGAQEITLELLDKTFTGKSKIFGRICSIKKSITIKPSITLMPSLLKREAFETVIYLAAQMGTTTIQPLLATKTHRAWNSEKEQVRLTKIMISACEQAKSFCIPMLKDPVDINSLTGQTHGVYFEDDGLSLATISHKLITDSPKEIALVFGPEGGLTKAERQHLDSCGFMCCALTPTILRAQEAVAVGLGALRSLLLYNK